MNYLLDTCMISELARPAPDARVLKWIESVEESALYLSVLTIGELEKGIARLPSSARRRKIESWVRAVSSQSMLRSPKNGDESRAHRRRAASRCR